MSRRSSQGNSINDHVNHDDDKSKGNDKSSDITNDEDERADDATGDDADHLEQAIRAEGEPSPRPTDARAVRFHRSPRDRLDRIFGSDDSSFDDDDDEDVDRDESAELLNAALTSAFEMRDTPAPRPSRVRPGQRKDSPLRREDSPRPRLSAHNLDPHDSSAKAKSKWSWPSSWFDVMKSPPSPMALSNDTTVTTTTMATTSTIGWSSQVDLIGEEAGGDDVRGNENLHQSSDSRKSMSNVKKWKIGVILMIILCILAVAAVLLVYFFYHGRRPGPECTLPETLSDTILSNFRRYRRGAQRAAVDDPRPKSISVSVVDGNRYVFNDYKDDDDDDDSMRTVGNDSLRLRPITNHHYSAALTNHKHDDTHRPEDDGEFEGDVHPPQCWTLSRRGEYLSPLFDKDGKTRNKRSSGDNSDFDIISSSSSSISASSFTSRMTSGASPGSFILHANAATDGARGTTSGSFDHHANATSHGARGAAAALEPTRDNNLLFGRIWPQKFGQTEIVVTTHPSEVDLWELHGAALRSAMKHWEKRTCVTFRHKKWRDVPDMTLENMSANTEHNLNNMVLVITRYQCVSGKIGTSCAAHVGAPCHGKQATPHRRSQDEPCIVTCAAGVPWKNPCPNRFGSCVPSTAGVKCIGNTLTIGQRCEADGITLKTLIHELGHVLGLYHEMNRGDRDRYIKILDGRLLPGKEINFLLPQHHPKVLNTPYDYLSIMHYAQYAFTRQKNCATMKTTSQCAQEVIGRTEDASFYDIMAVNTMYRCNMHCSNHDYETWKRKGYGQCGSEAGCYLDRGCACVCPKKWEKDLRYLPRDHPLYEHLPDDKDKSCRLGSRRISTDISVLFCCAVWILLGSCVRCL